MAVPGRRPPQEGSSGLSSRKGIGRAILDACEAAARAEGFRRAELVSTLASEPLYRACGYVILAAFDAPTNAGVPIPVHRIGKAL